MESESCELCGARGGRSVEEKVSSASKNLSSRYSTLVTEGSGDRKTMGDLFNWVWGHLIGRIDGPLTFRLVLQPVMAVIIAICDGLKDAREGRVPYFWAIFTKPAQRGELIREGWRAVAKVFILATLMDLIYQYLILGWLYPVAALFIAFILAFVPYLLIRGPVNRIARLR
jgi:hypothetical protein